MDNKEGQFLSENSETFISQKQYDKTERCAFFFSGMLPSSTHRGLTNLILLQDISHANHAITEFQHVSTTHREKSLAASLSQAFADVVTHVHMGQ